MTTATSLTTADLEALERESWIDPATADAWGLSRVTSAEGALLVGRTDREDYAGIVFSLYGPGDERPKDYHLRRDHPPLEQHNGQLKPRQKYLAPPGRGNRLLFGPGESVDSLANIELPIVLVEGLKKLCAVWRLARHDENPAPFFACGISGVWNWRGTVARAPDATGTRVDVRGVIPDFDRVTWTDREVCVLFDSDTATNPKVLAAGRGLVAELQRRGAHVTAPDLPALDGLGKTGVDDLLAHWGPARVVEWLNEKKEKAPTGAETEVTRLAVLSILAYGQERKAAARKLDLPLDFLDTAVAAARRERATTDDGKGHAITFEEVIPAFEQVDGADLADRLIAVFTRFAALPKHGATALTLRTLFTYCLDLFQIAPRLDLSSPEKQCGKTTTLSLLNRLAFRAALSSNISPAAIFRVIARHKPTLLIDEMDTFIEANEALRGILNSGHTKEAASIIRCEGDDHEPKRFSTWAAMAFAHIGKIPDTLEDRSIRLPMRRKLPSERVESLRQTGPAAVALHEELSTLRREMMRWIEDHSGTIAAATPSTVEGLSDRASDNWLPLFAIAEVVGGTWPKKSQEAAASLSGHGTTDNQSIKVELLIDLQTIFNGTYVPGGKPVSRVSSADLCTFLALMEDRPWGTWKHGKPITQVQLARLLKPFGVSSRTIKREGQVDAKGYLIEDFADAFTRYISFPPGDFTLSKRLGVTTRSQRGDNTVFRSVTTDDGDVSKNGLNPALMAESDAVTFRNGESNRGKRFSEESETEGGMPLYPDVGEEALNGND
jgi:hypothetical protein